MKKLHNHFRALVADEEGAQVIEYALIVAVIAVAFVIALRAVLGSDVAGFLLRLNTCLMNGVCT